MIPASSLHFGGTNFSAGEWPKHNGVNVLEYMSSDVIKLLFDIRKKAGVSMFPSPLVGAHIRDRECGSRHCLIHNGQRRLSDATDFFVRWEDRRIVWDVMKASNAGGIGFYPLVMFKGSVGSYIMFHIDCRQGRREWVGWRESQKDSFQYIVKRQEYEEHEAGVFS